MWPVLGWFLQSLSTSSRGGGTRPLWLHFLLVLLLHDGASLPSDCWERGGKGGCLHISCQIAVAAGMVAGGGCLPGTLCDCGANSFSVERAAGGHFCYIDSPQGPACALAADKSRPHVVCWGVVFLHPTCNRAWSRAAEWGLEIAYAVLTCTVQWCCRVLVWEVCAFRPHTWH